MKNANERDARQAADALLYAQISARAVKFRDRGLALRHAATTVKPQRVMLGDDGRFWIVRPVDADRLERMGYEYAV